ncbi:Na+-transporting methylmalonyl-CoA/oxaloacetate decarboxylase gamma subunit [Paraburkholderia sp. JPY171]|nr:Na+-transporting methylmalonyl-CoA/oxaloacetate decarboxylase gamma subunit [Paraburkholderia atlantica]
MKTILLTIGVCVCGVCMVADVLFLLIACGAIK